MGWVYVCVRGGVGGGVGGLLPGLGACWTEGHGLNPSGDIARPPEAKRRRNAPEVFPLEGVTGNYTLIAQDKNLLSETTYERSRL